MSQAPYLLTGARWGYRMGDGRMVDGMIHDGLLDVFNHYHMGITAENVAEKFGVTRQEQDELAFRSQQNAGAGDQGGAIQGGDRSRAHSAEQGRPRCFRHG